MKKTVIIANDYLILFKFRKELILNIIEKGYQVIIIAPHSFDYKEYFIELGCKCVDIDVDRRGINIFKDLKLYRTYYKVLKEIKPDKVITYTIKPNIYGGFVCKRLKISYYANITGLGSSFQKKGLLKNIVVFLYKKALKDVNMVFFQNEDNRNKFIDSNIINYDKAIIINGSGVNLSEFTYSPYPSDDMIRFLFMGRIMKEKGINELLFVAEKIKQDNSKISFDLIGYYEDDYVDIIKEFSNKGIINYYGFRDDVKKFISESHCIILPSYHEGMSNTLLESAAMGRPLITSNIPGCKETVKDGITGYLCEVRNYIDLYEKVKAFIELDYESKKTMGIESRKYIEEKFDRSKVTKIIIEKIYK